MPDRMAPVWMCGYGGVMSREGDWLTLGWVSTTPTPRQHAARKDLACNIEAYYNIYNNNIICQITAQRMLVYV